MSDGFDPRVKFPDLTPVDKPPKLGMIAGIGLALDGPRDHDEETGSFVVTHWFRLWILPLFALGAYRLIATEAGLYMLGRVPLSAAAKLWNCLVLAAVVVGSGGYGWHVHVNSPEYRAKTTLAQAATAQAAGDLPEAARLFGAVATGDTTHAAAACAALQTLLDGPLRERPLTETAPTLAILVDLKRDAPVPLSSLDVQAWAVKLVQTRGQQDIRGALLVLDQVARLPQAAEPLNALRRDLLEQLVKKEPQDPAAASQLAVVYEQQGDLDKCEALLAPHAERLGMLEGARILGQLYARQGKEEQGEPLLRAYSEQRLKALHAAEKTYADAVEAAQATALADLKARRAPPDLYHRLENAGEARQREVLEEFVRQRLTSDPAVRRAQEAMIEKAHVVPVALDLGIVLLHRAQQLQDAEARRQGMEQAEQMFLAIQGFASDNDQYRLALGQVYYWLGKHAEGRALFDALLTEEGRSPKMLTAVAMLLRDLGAFSECRTLAEEAHGKGSKEEKYAAAGLRAITATDVDDSVTWLQRADPANLGTRAELSAALGDQALRAGDRDQAARHYREAIETYGRLPESDATLNNGGIVHLHLFQATGDMAALERGTAMIRQAVERSPDDAVLILNAAGTILEASLRQLIGDAVDLRALKMSGGLGLLSYLYADEASHTQYVARVREHEGIQTALRFFERGLTLAPKRASVYGQCAQLYHYLQDTAALQTLLRRAQEAQPDLDEQLHDQLDMLSGKRDDQWKQPIPRRLEELRQIIGKEPAATPGRCTWAVAATECVEQSLGGDLVGLPADADEVVRLAKRAYETLPCEPTCDSLISALCFRGSRRLAQQAPAYDRLRTQCQRAVGVNYLLTIAMTRDAEVRKKALDDPDIQRVLGLLADVVPRFPNAVGPWDWALLRHANPAAGQQAARAVRENETATVSRQLALLLSPASGAAAYQSAWAAEIAGNDEQARTILQTCREQGAPLPD